MQKQNNQVQNNPQRQYASGRSILLSIIIFTVVNLLMLVMDVGTMFLYSASVPYYLTLIGKGMDNGFSSGAWDRTETFTIAALEISAVILAVYVLCWIFSKKRGGWMTAALVLFILDTLALVLISFTLLEEPMANILDFVFHALILWQLAASVSAGKKLKAQAQENPVLDEGCDPNYNGNPEF